MSKSLEDSPNALINKTLLDKYMRLSLNDDQIQATYIWIDGSGENVRCKDRTLAAVPASVKGRFRWCSRSDKTSIWITKLKNSWFFDYPQLLCG